MARFVTIWFRHLKTDWHSIRQPALRDLPFVLSSPDHGRLIITAVNKVAHERGVETGMVVSDAVPSTLHSKSSTTIPNSLKDY